MGTEQNRGPALPNSRCAADFVLFAVGVAFGAIGLLVSGSQIAEVAYDVLTQFQWETAFTATGLEGLGQFVENLGWWIFVTFVLPNLAEWLPWWAIPGFLLEWTPPAWAARAVLLVGAIAIGLANLATEGCL